MSNWGPMRLPIILSLFLFLLTCCLVDEANAQVSTIVAKRSDCAQFGGAINCFPANDPPKGIQVRTLLPGEGAGDTAPTVCSTTALNQEMNDGHFTYIILPYNVGEDPPFWHPRQLNLGSCTNSPPFRDDAVVHFPVLKFIKPWCPAGSQLSATDSEGNTAPPLCIPEPTMCDSCAGNFGNPINAFTGAKLQVEVDYAGRGLLRFERRYMSRGMQNINAHMGKHWFHNYQKALLIKPGQINLVFASRGDGRTLAFRYDAGYWNASGKSVDNLHPELNGDGEVVGWRYEEVDLGNVEIYDVEGRLLTIRRRGGEFVTLKYSGSELIQVSDNFGRSIKFFYDDKNRLSQMKDPEGNIFEYRYDESAQQTLIRNFGRVNSRAFDNLTSVVYPGGGIRKYWYSIPSSETDFESIYLLEKITDENGILFAKFGYGWAGKAVSTEHAGGVEKYVANHHDGYTTMVLPSGISSNFWYKIINHEVYLDWSSVPRSQGGTGEVKGKEYDLAGNLIRTRDFNNIYTTYTYDTVRRLEVSRTVASGTAQALTTTTLWHATLRLPAQIYEPLKRTIFEYNDDGLVLTRIEQGTTDSNGSQGVSAQLVGDARVWIYTYNNVGQVLTVKGPRTDVNDVTTNVYDAQGNLIGVTNGAGHTTSLSNYDAHGHVGRIVDPNGVVTEMSYHPRGWLLSKSVTADGYTETTNYTYDGVGQLTQVTLPDATQIHYTYDNAHRLISIADHLGNTINYALDNMGNRVKEEVKDSTGNLTRQVTRVYDTLNRLQQVTGGMQ